MIATPLKPTRRPAAALIETVAVVGVFLMFLFGVLEYCRYIFIRQLTANATREGARYAVANTFSPTVDADTKARVLQFMGGMDGSKGIRNFTVQIYAGDSSGNMAFEFNPGPTPGTTANYAYQTSGSTKYLTDNTTPTPTKFNILQDASKNYYVTDPKNGNAKVFVTLDSLTPTVKGVNASAWSSFITNNKIMNVTPPADAQFGTYVVVQIDCDYDPILPVLYMMPSTLHIQTKAVMYSEAN